MRTYNKDSNEASDRSVPVSIRARFSNKHRVKDKVAQAKLDASFFFFHFLLMSLLLG